MCWKPHATVACVIEKDGRFLMVEEFSNGKLVLNQPAGHVEDNETLVAAALRETHEETCCSVEITDFIGLYVFRPEHKDATYHRLCFAARFLELHSDCALDPEIERNHWLTYEEIKANEHRLRSPMVLQAVDDFLAGKRYPLSLIQESPVR